MFFLCRSHTKSIWWNISSQSILINALFKNCKKEKKRTQPQPWVFFNLCTPTTSTFFAVHDRCHLNINRILQHISEWALESKLQKWQRYLFFPTGRCELHILYAWCGHASCLLVVVKILSHNFVSEMFYPFYRSVTFFGGGGGTKTTTKDAHITFTSFCHIIFPSLTG